MGMLDHARSLLEDENMEQIERIFCAVDYVLNEIEYFVRVAKRTSSTNLLVRKHELTTLKKVSGFGRTYYPVEDGALR